MKYTTEYVTIALLTHISHAFLLHKHTFISLLVFWLVCCANHAGHEQVFSIPLGSSALPTDECCDHVSICSSVVNFVPQPYNFRLSSRDMPRYFSKQYYKFSEHKQWWQHRKRFITYNYKTKQYCTTNLFYDHYSGQSGEPVPETNIFITNNIPSMPNWSSPYYIASWLSYFKFFKSLSVLPSKFSVVYLWF